MANIVAVGEANLRAGVHRQHVGRELLAALVHVCLECTGRRIGRALQGHYRVIYRSAIGLLQLHLKRRRTGPARHR